MRDKYGNYVIQRVIDISHESQRKPLIEKILKAALTMKKHKSHARHVFNFLEKSYGINVVFVDDDSGSKKDRKSTGTVTGGKLSTISKSGEVEGTKMRGTNSCLVDRGGFGGSIRKNNKQGAGSNLANSNYKKSNNMGDDGQDHESTATGGGRGSL